MTFEQFYDISLTLVQNSIKDIRTDLFENVLQIFPLGVIISPDQYNPPFINNFFNILDKCSISPGIENCINFICLLIDIIYGFFRLFLSILLCGTAIIGQLLVWFGISIVLSYRWELFNIDLFGLNLVG